MNWFKAKQARRCRDNLGQHRSTSLLSGFRVGGGKTEIFTILLKMVLPVSPSLVRFSSTDLVLPLASLLLKGWIALGFACFHRIILWGSIFKTQLSGRYTARLLNEHVFAEESIEFLTLSGFVRKKVLVYLPNRFWREIFYGRLSF